MPKGKTKRMRRLSLYFTGGEAATILLEPKDILVITAKEIKVTGKLGVEPFERWINRVHVMHYFMVHYTVEIQEKIAHDPEAVEVEGLL